MSFSWIDYLRLAEELVQQARAQPAPALSEAKLRSAISRAYYAGHTLAREYLIEEEHLSIERTGNAHARVIDEFEAYRDGRRQVGVTLRRLRQDRGKVDYHNTLTFNLAHQAQLALKQANGIVDVLKGFMTIPGLTPDSPKPLQ